MINLHDLRENTHASYDYGIQYMPAIQGIRKT